MSGMKNTVKRLGNFATLQGYSTKKERDAAKAAGVQAGKDEMFAGAEMPDEEQIKRNERRKAAKRRGSRVNTVLTDRETVG